MVEEAETHTMPSGGGLTVSTANTTLTEEVGISLVRASVWDYRRFTGS